MTETERNGNSEKFKSLFYQNYVVWFINTCLSRKTENLFEGFYKVRKVRRKVEKKEKSRAGQLWLFLIFSIIIKIFLPLHCLLGKFDLG